MASQEQGGGGRQKLAEKASGLICMYPEAKDLTSEERARLHAFKHDVIAGIFRLYIEMDDAIVDAILRRVFANLIDEVGGGA